MKPHCVLLAFDLAVGNTRVIRVVLVDTSRDLEEEKEDKGVYYRLWLMCGDYWWPLGATES